MFKWFEDRKEAKRLKEEKDALLEKRRVELVTFCLRDSHKNELDQKSGLSRLPDGFYFNVAEVEYLRNPDRPYRLVTLKTPEGDSLGSRKEHLRVYYSEESQKRQIMDCSILLREDVVEMGEGFECLYPDLAGNYPPNKI